jgi:hypothetical protein
LKNVSSLEAVQRDFGPQGVKFYYVYKTLAHPETNGFVQPFSLAERLMHVREAKQRLGTQFTWICDTMANEVRNALGDAPNSEFVIDPQGIVVRKRLWSNPEKLRADLNDLVGPVEKPTESVAIDFQSPLEDEGRPASGVLDRISPASSTYALNIEPMASKLPYYVKLRAEADDPLLETGKGQMYLGFHIDPIYGVHWNNLADPMQFELSLPAGVSASPQTGSGPQLEVSADIDPREFLIAVSGFSSEPMYLKVRYFACDDDETFCVPVEQEYRIHPTANPEGGWVFARGGRPRRRARRPEPTVLAAGPQNRTPVEDSSSGEKLSQDATDEPSAAVLEDSVAHIEGRISGRIDGYVKARLRGRFRGKVDGSFQGSGATIQGRLEGKIDGRFQGRLVGEFEGEFRGQLGSTP